MDQTGVEIAKLPSQDPPTVPLRPCTPLGSDQCERVPQFQEAGRR